MTKRHCYFLALLLMAFSLAVPPLARIGISLSSDYYSHIPLIPLVSAYLLYRRKNILFNAVDYAPCWGFSIAGAGLFLYTAEMWASGMNKPDSPPLLMFSSLLFLYGSFISLYGIRAFKRSIFPLLFLLFTVPIPSALMERIINFLQVGSAEITDLIFKVTAIPYFRQGLIFQLPGFSIEVAKQCSGIHSSLALLITVVLAAHFFLRTYWQKVVLILWVLPMVLVKNGVRISALTFLGMYVDQRILTEGFLHKSGGIFFFMPALALMGILLWILRRVDAKWFQAIGPCFNIKRSADSSLSSDSTMPPAVLLSVSPALRFSSSNAQRGSGVPENR